MTPESQTSQAMLEETSKRVMELLAAEGRAMHGGDIAARLAVPTHMVHTSMHVPLQRGEAWFHASEGYSLPAREQRQPQADDGQRGLQEAANG
jgi:hypothetical protein